VKIIILFCAFLPISFGLGMLFEKSRAPAYIKGSTTESVSLESVSVEEKNKSISDHAQFSDRAYGRSFSGSDCQPEAVPSIAGSVIESFQGDFGDYLLSQGGHRLSADEVDQLVVKFSMTAEQLALFYQSVNDDSTRDHIDRVISERSVPDKLIFADQLIDDPDAENRALGYLIYGDTHSSEHNNIEKLVDASYGEVDPNATNAILEALVVSCVNASRSENDLCVDRMAYFVDYGSPSVAESSLELLTRMPATSTTEQIFKDKLSSPNPEVQNQSLNGLFNFESTDELTLITVKRIADDLNLSPRTRELAKELLEHYSN